MLARKNSSQSFSMAGAQSGMGCRLLGSLGVVSLVQMCLPWSAFSQELNLGSSDTSHTVDQNFNGTVNLTVNGEQKTVSGGSQLTAAEYATFINAINGGAQTLNIGQGGVAIGGHLELTPHLAQNITGLVVPSNVSLLHDVGALTSLNLTGNLTNSGNYFAFSTNNAITNGIINASNLYNNQGALLTSVLPSAGLPGGITGAISNLSLTLNIVNNLYNAGAITSAGNLNINAGAIYNQLPAGVTGASPIMQAVNNLNLNATLGNITNSGTLAAITGNVNLASLNNMVVNNVNGSIQALMGNINVRDAAFDAKKNLDILGGNFVSNQLNLHSGDGLIDVNITGATGLLNVTGGSLHVITEDTLNLGSISLSGDPGFYVTRGDLNINADLVFPGMDLALVAAGNVRTVAPNLQISTEGATGGSLLVSAGGSVDSFPPVTIRDLENFRTQGGNIDFSTFALGAPLSTRGTAGNGGNLTLVTLGGQTNAGTIAVPTLITSSGAGGGTAGNITIISDAQPGNVNNYASIVLGGGVEAAGVSANNTGQVRIATAKPVYTTVGSQVNPILTLTGDAVAAPLLSITVGAVRNSSIEILGGVQASGGIDGKVLITSGNQLTVTGPITTTNDVGGDINIQVNSPVAFTAGNLPGGQRNGVGGVIQANGTNGNAANISITNAGTGGIVIPNANDISASGTNGNGGGITLAAPNGDLNFTAAGLLNVQGTTDGGTIALSGRRILDSGNLMLLADGGAGNGGAVNMASTLDGRFLNVTAGGVSINVSGGTNAGSVTLSSAGDLTVDPGQITALAGNGNGASLSFATAGTNALSRLVVTSSINLVGTGTGTGGSVNLNSVGALNFEITGGAATNNGVAGIITTQATGTGAGGSISVTSARGMLVDGTLQSNSLGGAGGSITLTANGTTNGQFGLMINNPGAITVTGLDGTGGNITLSSAAAPLSVGAPGTLNANGTGNGAGGNITVSAQSIVGGTLSFSANGAGNGGGGNVTVTTTSRSFDLTVGAMGNTVGSISALAGAVGGGGIVSLSSGANLGVAMAGITADPTDGNGARFNFTAGTATNGSGPGNLQIVGNVFANGAGANGSGGSVNLTSNSFQVFGFGVAPGANGLTGGQISVTSTGTGAGGTIAINNAGSGGISVLPANLVTTASAAGANVNLTAANGAVNLNGSYSVDAGANQGAGGTFNVTARDLVINPGSQISANGSAAGGGAGGSISLTETGETSNAFFNVTTGNLALSANAGAGGTGGSGGAVSISVPRGLVVDPALLTVAAAGTGNGGSLTLSAGTAVRSNLRILGGLNLSGLTSGAGGVITLTATGNVRVEGSIIATGVGTGQGGQVFITANGDMPFLINNMVVGNSVNSINVSSAAANGGRISITNPLGITLGNLTLLNLAAGNGSGGTLTLSATNGPISIDAAAQNFINLNGNAGSGGQFNFTAERFVVTNGTVDLQASGAAGSGGIYSLTSTAANADLTVMVGGQFIISGGGSSVMPKTFNPMVTPVPAGTTTLTFNNVSGLAAGQLVNLSQPFVPGGPITVNNVLIQSVDNNANTVTFATPLPASAAIPGGTTAFAGNNQDITLTLIPQSAAGSVTLSSGRNLTVTSANVVVAPTAPGQGANYTYVAGSSGAIGNVLVNGGIDAAAFQGGGTFNGGSVSVTSTGNTRITGNITTQSIGIPSASGSITLVSNSNSVFTVDNADAGALNGVFGILDADGPNAPGSISITNNGVGGINIANATTHLLQIASNASGASFTANAGLGTFSVAQSSTINVNGNGVILPGGGRTAGGTISITAASFAPIGHLSLLAQGGTGPGGTVTVNATGASSFIEIHPTNLGAININTSAGTGNSGNGGIMNITAGTRLLIDPTALVNQTGGGGVGQNMTFTATGQAGGCCGSVLFTSPVNFAGQTTSVVVNVNSVTPFTIGNPGTSGNGIVADGLGLAVDMDGTGGGAGGNFTINQSGNGGVVINNGTTLRARAGAGDTPFSGGNISISTGSGGLTFGNGTIDVSVPSSAGSSVAPGNVPPNPATGSPQARGGTITISTNQLVTNAGATGALVVNAFGGVYAQGGTVNLTTTNGTVPGGTNNMVLGTAAGQFNVDARGGTVGGTLNFNSGGNLTVTAANAQFGALDPLLNFDGGRVSLTASGNVTWNGNLNASGQGIGDGGSVTIRHNGFSTFAIGSAFGAGITGTLSASAGSIAGNGGIIDISTGNALLSVPGGFVFDANARSTTYAVGPSIIPGENINRGGIAGVATGPVSGSFNGGRVTINTSFISVSTAGTVTMQANGAGQGNGGTVQFTQTLPIQAGGAGNVFNFTATGGSANSIGGNGGTINVNSNGGVNVQSAASFNANPLGSLGNGGNYSLNGGANGPITVAFGLNADAVSTIDNAPANGGTISITQSSGAFSIGAGTVGPGVAGDIRANSGSLGGNGGSITLALGSSGLTLRGVNTLIEAIGSTALGGSGNQSNGGTINITSGVVTNLTSASSSIVVTGGRLGTGGTVGVTTSGALNIGSGAGLLNLVAGAGGAPDRGRSNGGSISVTAASMSISTAPNVSVSTSNGNGGTIILTATTGAITSTVNISANGGNLAGNGGRIDFITASGAPLQLNSGGTLFNGISGNLSARGGSQEGNGGTILVRNNVASGIILGGAAGILNVASANLAGNTFGSITLDAVNGPLTINAPQIAVNPAVGNGGNISLTGSVLNLPTGFPVVLRADGGFGGNAGTIAVRTTQGNTAASNITIGVANGNLAISARGGNSVFGVTNGGTVNVESAGFQFTVDPLAGLAVGTQGADGNGGTIRFTAAGQPGTSGNLQITGNLSVNGVGQGNGGTVVIRAKGVNNFTLGANTVNGVNGVVSADSGPNGGNAGTIDIEQSSANAGGGIVFATLSPLSAAAAQGNPGSIRVVANGLLPIQFNGNTILNVNALSGNRNGGALELGAARYVFNPGASVLLAANASGTGNGGTVIVRGTGTSGNAADMTFGNAAGQISIAAQGGTAGLAGGNGGTLTLLSASASNNLTIIPAGLLIGPRGEVGNGGTITATSGLNLFINGPLNVDSATLAGNGGTGTFTSGGTFPAFTIGAGAATNGVNGSLTARALGQTGNGGTLSVTSTTAAGIALGAVPSILVNGGTVSGNGGTISLTATNNGTINLGTAAVPLSVDGTGMGNAGTLTLSSSILTINPAANQTLQARGGLNGGQGGTINVTVTSAGSPLTIGAGAGQLALAINSNGNGRSGAVNVSTSANLNVNSAGLFLLGAALGDVGSTVNFTSGAGGGFGNLTTTGVFNVGLGSNALLSLAGPVITQNAGGLYQGKAVTLVTAGSLGTALAPIQTQVGVDPAGGLQARATSFGSVFINQNGAMALGASSAGFQFNVTANNDINVTGAISGANLSQINLATTANGSINLRADVGGSSFATANINANGTGAITNNAGVVRVGTLNLVSGSGNIGTSASRVITTATTISANTTGNVFLFAAASPTTPGGFAPSVTINASSAAVFDYLACGSVNFVGNVTAPVLQLGTFSGNITASGSALNNVTTIGITAANNATISKSAGNLTLARSSVTNSLSVTTAGVLTINGPVTGNQLSFASNGAGGGIVINGDITGTELPGQPANSQVTFTSFVGNNLFRTFGTVSANTVNFNMGSGAVGTAGTRIRTNANFINNSGFGVTNNVFINEISGVQLGSFGFLSAGGSFDMTVNDGQTTFQSITAGGSISIVKNGFIGNLTQLAGGFTSTINGAITVTASGSPMVLNGSLSAGGTGAITVTSNGIGLPLTVGNLSTNNANITVTSAGGITQNAFSTISTNNGDINLVSVGGGNVLLNGTVRTNISGNIGVTAVAGSVATNSMSTGFSGPNAIGVFAIGGSLTVNPNSFVSSGQNGNIQLQANNGSVTLTNANVSTSGTGTLTVSAVGGSGGVNLGTLSSNSGAITVTTTPVNSSILGTGSFSSITSSSGTITLNAVGAGTAGINLTGDVSTTTTGNITVFATGSGGISVRNIRTGFTGPNNNILLSAPGASGGAVTQAAFTSLSTGTGGTVTVLSDLTANLQSIMAGGAVTVQSFSAGVTQAASTNVSGSSVAYTANAPALGNVAINGMVRSNAGALTVNAGNNITVNSSLTSTGGNLSLTANNGAIVSNASGFMSASGGNLLVQTNNGASGNITLGAGLTVNNDMTGVRTLTVASARSAIVGSLSNFDPTGLTQVTATTGVLQMNGFVSVQGDLNIYNTGGAAAGDAIVLGNFVSLFALAPSAPQGNITIALLNGQAPPPPNVVGVPPAGGTVTQSTSGGGQIFFGPQQFTNTGSTSLIAKGANITFFNNKSAGVVSSGIQLNSNFIFADPPTPVGTPASMMPVAMPSAMSLPATTPSTAPAVGAPAPAAQSQTPPATRLQMPAAVQGIVDIFRPFFVSPNATTTTPVDTAPIQHVPVMPATTNDVATQVRDAGGAMVQSAVTNVNNVLTGFVAKKAGMFNNATTYMRPAQHAVVQQLDESTFDLKHGEVIVSANRRSTVVAGEHSVDAAAGSIVHVTRDGDVLKVRNLCDSSGKAVRVLLAGKSMPVNVGEEVVVASSSNAVDSAIKADSIGRRKVTRFVVDGRHAITKSELSVIALIRKSNLLSSMYTKGSSADRSVMERIMKMAAALFQVTGKRGAYSAYDPSKVGAPIPLSSAGEQQCVKVAQSRN